MITRRSSFWPARFATASVSARAWLIWFAAGAVLSLTSVWALNYATTHLPDRALRAKVYKGSQFEGDPVVTMKDPALDPSKLAERAGLDPRQPFSVEWEGHAVVETSGRHHLRVAADDGVAVWVDQKSVVEMLHTPGHHDLGASVEVERGLHAI